MIITWAGTRFNKGLDDQCAPSIETEIAEPSFVLFHWPHRNAPDLRAGALWLNPETQKKAVADPTCVVPNICMLPARKTTLFQTQYQSRNQRTMQINRVKCIPVIQGRCAKIQLTVQGRWGRQRGCSSQKQTTDLWCRCQGLLRGLTCLKSWRFPTKTLVPRTTPSWRSLSVSNR